MSDEDTDSWSCPFCSTEFDRDKQLRKHLLKTICSQYAADPRWSESIYHTYQTDKGRKSVHARQAALVARQNQIARRESSNMSASAYRSQALFAMTDSEESSEDSLDEEQFFCVFCDDDFSDLSRLRAHLCAVHDDQYKTKKFRKAMLETYEPKQAETRLATALGKIAAKHETTKAKDRQQQKEKQLELERARKKQQQDKKGVKVKSEKKVSNASGQDSQRSKSADMGDLAMPVKPVYHRCGAWSPLRQDYPSPPLDSAQPRDVIKRTSPGPESSSEQRIESISDCTWSESILIWYVWYIARRTVLEVSVTAELVLLQPFENLVPTVQDALDKVKQEGRLEDEVQNHMAQAFGSDMNYQDADKEMQQAVESDKGSSSMAKFFVTEHEKWSIILISWMTDLQEIWIKLGDRVVKHAAAQSWRAKGSSEVYKWKADGTSLFQGSEATQLMLVQCLTMHWNHWQPLFLNTEIATKAPAANIESIVNRQTKLYARDLADLIMEPMG
jgi:hypothetical protein